MALTVLTGDVRKVLPTIPDNSIDCVVTSPPYWGLRDYGHEDQIGLEPTMNEYLVTMTKVCRELRRVLKPEGTFWLNIGDCYASNAGGSGFSPDTLTKQSEGKNSDGRRGRPITYSPSHDKNAHGLKSKDLCMIPNRLAIMLQEDGWYVRSEIIWHKPNPMPESVKDRPTCSHEKVWLLTKSEKYFYNSAAIAEKANYSGVTKKINEKNAEEKMENGVHRASAWARPGDDAFTVGDTRNARNVWKIATKPFKDAHFATMPVELAEKCIKAGCPEGGMVLDPFGGAGTTAFAANRNGRNATLIELNGEYIQIAEDRVAPNLLDIQIFFIRNNIQ